MFGSDENINCIEALIPTEEEQLVFILTSSGLTQSNFLSDRYIKDCELRHIWKDYIS